MNENNLSINEFDVENFFKKTEEVINKAREHDEQECGSDFNFFDFFWLSENTVSSIIAFFLDPNGKHNEGDIYLKLFIKKFNLDFFEFNGNDGITVNCEYNIYGGRIDILIYNNFKQAIAIENKFFLNTPDQKNQIRDYLQHLQKKFKKYCLLYLCPLGKTPSEESISREDREKAISENKLKIITYEEHMIERLHEFENLTQNPKVKLFLKDFLRKLKIHFMIEIGKIADLIKENPKHLELSFLIREALQKAKEKLKEEFAWQLKKLCKEELKELVETVEFENNNKVNVHIKPLGWENNRISFRYEYGGLLYGIFFGEELTDESKSKLSEAISKKLEVLRDQPCEGNRNELIEFSNKFKSSQYWLAYAYFYENIENNLKFWIDIKNGEAQRRAKDFIKLICENLKNEEL